uniref:Dynein regulatory complex subunit 7 n=1 Tax=Strongyloides papillosus TaxID=174720 RepID=A0A0N5BSS2_STREA
MGDGKSSNNIFNSDNVEIIPYYPLNITIITSWKGIDEMSLDEIAIFCQLIYQINGGAGIIEIGGETKQLDAILTHSAFCWGKGSIKSDIINRIFFCNNFEYTNFKLLDNSKPIHNNYLKYQKPTIENTGSWSFNILGATHAQETENDDKKQKTPTKNIIDVDVEKLKLIRRHNYANKKKVRRHRHRKIVGNKVIIDMSKVRSAVRKYECKYRKSCYETGQLNLDIIYKDPIETVEAEKVPLTVDQLKLICKYRKSCYDSAGIPNEQKKLLEDNDDDDKIGLFTGGGKQVIKATKKNKKTLKNIAKKILKNAQKKSAVMAEKFEENPNVAFEKYLDETEKLYKKKLDCKFRKSCYETGIVPIETQPPEPLEVVIQRYWDWLEQKFNFDVDFNIVKEEVPFDDLSSEDKKIRCHYRKSCYENGIVPNISVKIFEEPVKEEVETESIFSYSEENKKLACKYRKSCYETGVLPQISVVVPEVKEKVVPLNEDDFKAYCKFRKSCYVKEAKLEVDEKIDIPLVKEEETQIKDDIINEVNEISIEAEKVNEPEVQEEPKKKEKKQKKGKKDNIQKDTPVEVIAEEVEILNEKKESTKDDVVDEKLPKVKKSKKSKKEQAKDKEAINVETSKPKETSKKSKKEEVIKEEPTNIDIPKPKETPKKSKKEEVNKEEPTNIDVSKSKDVPKKVKKTKTKKEEKVIEESVVKVEEQPDPPKPIEEPKKSKVTEQKPSKESDKPSQPKKVKKEKQKIESKTPDKEEQPIEKENWYKNIDFERYMNSIYDLAKMIQNTDYSSYFKTQETQPKEHHEHVFDPEEENRKVKCHYRKSCYETGKIPNLTHHVLEPPVVVVQEHTHIFNKEEEDKKLACKYRKSCYETGELPNLTHHVLEPPVVVVQEYSHIFNKEEEDKKLACKYRKSCYETGKLPIMMLPKTIHEPKVEIKVPDDEEELKAFCKYRKSCYETKIPPNIKEEKVRIKETKIPLSEYQIKMSCKYRKSCYQKSNDYEPKDEEEKVEKQKEPKTQTKKSKKTKADSKDKIKKPIEISKEQVIIEMSNRTESVTGDNIKIIKTSDDKIVEIIQSQGDVKSSTDKPIKCNPFRISCKQLLGLPLSEKAPRAKNGKRLCRKKKPTT